MNALLEIPEIRRHVFAFPVELYHKLPEGLPTELLRGTIIEKERKCPQHRRAVEKLRRMLAEQVEPELVVFQYAPITTHDSEPEPDLSVVPGPIERFDHEHPRSAELVIEVAVASLAVDIAKASIYAEAGVKEYWIVRPEVGAVEVYRDPQGGAYTDRYTVTAPAVLQCAAVPKLRVDLQELFA